MKEWTYTIQDAVGMHARPAGLLVKEAQKFSSQVTVHKDGKAADSHHSGAHARGGKL